MNTDSGLIATVPNGRDLGGKATDRGARVRPGVLFRSAAPTQDAASAALTALDVRTVFDLRTSAERAAQPARLPDHVTGVVADMLADAPGSGAASMSALAEPLLRGERVDVTAGEVETLMLESYRGFVTLPSAQRATAAYLTAVGTSTGQGAVLFHCTAGKDRTGFLAALTLRLLGVHGDDILADYLASGPEVAKALAPFEAMISTKGIDASALRPAIEVREQYLQASWDALAEAFGSLDDYLTEGLGLAPQPTRDALAERLLL